MTDGALIRGHLTIGVPVHNGEAFLAAMLENLLADELDRVCVVVSDNASTDATVDIALAAAGRDERIMVRRQPHNVGANATSTRWPPTAARSSSSGRPSTICSSRACCRPRSPPWTTRPWCSPTAHRA
ncbi:MAG: glycosyltransferase [Acidimicrobiales bacterium]